MLSVHHNGYLESHAKRKLRVRLPGNPKHTTEQFTQAGKYNGNRPVPDRVGENGLTSPPPTGGTGKVAIIIGSDSLHMYYVGPIGQAVGLITHGLTKGQRKGKEL